MDIMELFAKIAKSPSAAGGKPAWLIFGLGNPGEKYAATRHNAGFLVLDRLAQKCGVSLNRLRFQALTAEATLGGVRVALLKPQTFMNLSGESVREAAGWYQLPMERVLVVYDDISLPVGKLRIREKGSAGGHNGIKSIIGQTGTEAFPRIKLGVGEKPEQFEDLADWVLSRFTDGEKIALGEAAEKACEAAELLVQGRPGEAMNRFNG